MALSDNMDARAAAWQFFTGSGDEDVWDSVKDTLNGGLSLADAATTDWVEPAVNPAWTIQGAPYEVPRYRKFMGVVYVEGLVVNASGGALGPADDVFRLPAGFRPRAIVNAVPFSASGMEISADGYVRVNNSIPNSTFLSLTISFVPDQ